MMLELGCESSRDAYRCPDIPTLSGAESSPATCGQAGIHCQGKHQAMTQSSSFASEEAHQAWRWRELCLARFCSHTINKGNWNICPELPCDSQWVSLADQVTVLEKPEKCLWYPVPDVLKHWLYRQSQGSAWLTGAGYCSIPYTVPHINPFLSLQSLRAI